MYGGLSMIDSPSDASNSLSEPGPQEEALLLVVHCSILLLFSRGISVGTVRS
jgi:hypothetical protein